MSEINPKKQPFTDIRSKEHSRSYPSPSGEYREITPKQQVDISRLLSMGRSLQQVIEEHHLAIGDPELAGAVDALNQEAHEAGLVEQRVTVYSYLLHAATLRQETNGFMMEGAWMLEDEIPDLEDILQDEDDFIEGAEPHQVGDFMKFTVQDLGNEEIGPQIFLCARIRTGFMQGNDYFDDGTPIYAFAPVDRMRLTVENDRVEGVVDEALRVLRKIEPYLQREVSFIDQAMESANGYYADGLPYLLDEKVRAIINHSTYRSSVGVHDALLDMVMARLTQETSTFFVQVSEAVLVSGRKFEVAEIIDDEEIATSKVTVQGLVLLEKYDNLKRCASGDLPDETSVLAPYLVVSNPDLDPVIIEGMAVQSVIHLPLSGIHYLEEASE